MGERQAVNVGLKIGDLPPNLVSEFYRGMVIPAHPLALDVFGCLDEGRQRALSRYYIDAGAGGLAVGVHTTQFAIREAGLYPRVLELAMETASSWSNTPILMIAGVSGGTHQAVNEACLARSLGYQACLLSLKTLSENPEHEVLEHCRRVATEMPIIGFYLQDAVGGVPLSQHFWQQFAQIDNVLGIKIAPFNRYRTLDVVRAVVNAGKERNVALYTGNDDHIVEDLLSRYRIARNGDPEDVATVEIVGGLLGHWSVWTKTAVDILKRCHQAKAKGTVSFELLTLSSAVTDMNSAVFDVKNNFAGVIAGCHEILRRQGLLEGIWCLDETEVLGPGQKEELDRVTAAYPHLLDDLFVQKNLHRWMVNGV